MGVVHYTIMETANTPSISMPLTYSMINMLDIFNGLNVGGIETDDVLAV